jgi:uncharacterized protein (TIGR03086 family)
MITTSHPGDPGRQLPSVDQLDGAALALLSYDVAMLDAADLARPTPCAGWDVADLLRHMNEQHEPFAAGLIGAAELAVDDPRGQFAVSAARWTLAMSSGADQVRVPGFGEPVGKEQVRAVHFIDMLVHRWDLAAALARPVETDTALVEAALPIAEFVNAPGSPLFGSAYEPPRTGSATATPTDRLVALLGRDPAWMPR